MKVLPTPYQRVSWRGVTLNRRTRDAVLWAEKKSGVRVVPAQGSYNKGGVAASGGTHDGGGAIDCSVRGLSTSQRNALVRALKDAGFAAWYREPLPGVWGAHIHAIATGDKELAVGARAQVLSFDAGKDGLRGNRPDPTYRPSPRVTWSWLLRKPVKR